MVQLNRAFTVLVVNGLGLPVKGASIMVFRDGIPKAQAASERKPLLFQVTGPGRVECEASYNGIHTKVEVEPNQAHVRIRLTRWITVPKLLLAGAAILALLIVALLNRGAIVLTRPTIQAHYFGAAPHNKRTVVVFVHGIFGDKATWESQKTSFPELLTSDPEFAGTVDAFLFEYYSPTFGPGSNVAELAKQLKASLEDGAVLRDHDQVVFLCHSMGGLVTRRALILMRDVQKVAMLYFYATPTNGADIAQIAGRVSSSPQLKSMLPLEGNEALQQVQDDWMNWKDARDLPSHCAYETIPTDGVIVVSQSSARALCNRLPDGIDADHIKIVKPESRSDPRYTRFATALREDVMPKTPSKTDQAR